MCPNSHAPYREPLFVGLEEGGGLKFEHELDMPGHYILYEIILAVLYSDKPGAEEITHMLQIKHINKR